MQPKFDTIPPVSDPEYTRPPDTAYDINADPEFRRHQAVDKVITDRLVNRITGRGDAQQTLYGSNPSNRCFAGVLANQYRYKKAKREDDSFQNIAKDVAPFSIGFKFHVDPDDLDAVTFEFTPDAKLYYRRFPTYEEQLEKGDLDSSNYEDPDLTEEERQARADGGHTVPENPQSLLSVYERMTPDFSTISISGTEIRDKARKDERIERTVTPDLEQAAEAYLDADRICHHPGEDIDEWDAEDVPPEALTDRAAFQEHLDTTFTGDPIPALWSAKVLVTATERDDGMLGVSVTLVNTHGENFDTDTEPSEDWQAYLFDAALTVETEEPIFNSFPSEEIRDRYQYDGNIYAIGKNCAVERLSESPVTAIRTTTVPVYQQPKYLSRETVEAPFEALADGDIDSILGNIESEMALAHEQYTELEDEVLTDAKTKPAREEFEKMLEEFEAERDRFNQGRELIQDDERVEKAFRALNRTFHRLGFNHWRLFQIVFIVMAIPDIVAQAEPDRDIDDALDIGDVIYFPTGGGKTEAYLGLVTFTAFHDRLRGKDFGMTALTKFPLRLLSLQQLQRIADVLCHAETVRRDHPEMEGDEFSVGYFVGKQNTPNETYNKNFTGADTNNVQKAIEDDEAKDEWLTVPECPYCGNESVEITGDLERMRIIHECRNPDCDEVARQGGESAELPIYITDDEVYRHTPTFVVSTIDKIAILGWQRRMRTLFGQVKTHCPEHGYSGESECLVADENSYGSDYSCSNDHTEAAGSTDPPSILIQDELHLLREEFGAFDSHYETFIQELINRYSDGEWDMKVVAATATIKGAESQVNALYWKESNTFPTPGPRLHQSFYAYEDPHELGRRMVGAIPRTVSRTLAINTIIRERARIIQEFQANPDALHAEMLDISDTDLGGPLDLPSQKDERRSILQELLEEYRIQVSYNIAKRNSDMLQRSVRRMINRQLDAYGDPYHRLTSVALTGETDMDVVRDALSRLEADDPTDPIDVVIATSMISHGVDVDKFNFISFFGMPRNTAEYIQAYSRVGRDHTGTVFVLFNAMRARDRSHYTRFEHYHRYQDLLVEATPLERWAQFAIDRTMPGLLVGLFLQHYDALYEDETEKRLYMYDGFNEALERDLITRDDAFEFIKRAYCVSEAQDEAWL
ncbi:helicase-related protein, partial [Halorubellus salinus]|uniref:helicase-related protein n=1 Tax=Halorubellus salinus TaxID=755309 RepID=UPI001D08BB52